MFVGMERVIDAMRARTETKVGFSGGRRIDQDIFDFECLKEAWYNACLHNAWYTGVPPQISVFDDRIEVRSIGPAPSGIPEEDLYGGRSAPINESLYRLAQRAGFVEESGMGIPTIIRRYGCDAVRFSGGSVTVTIPFAYEPDRVLIRTHRGLADTILDENERKVLDFIRADRCAKVSEIAEGTGMSESSVKRTIASLKGKRVLENLGNNRRSRWHVPFRCDRFEERPNRFELVQNSSQSIVFSNFYNLRKC